MRWAIVSCLGALLAAAPLTVLAADAGSAEDGNQSKTSAPRQRGRLGTASAQTPLLFNADEVQYDQDLGLVVAKGHVELSQGDQILLADTVTYNQRTNTVTASGHVSFLQPTGDILFADFVELHDDLRDGFIRDVRILLSDRSRLAGNTARRVAANRTEIRRGVYSPCDLCKEDPTRPPEWQVRAEQIVRDRELQLVEFRDATLEIGGLPVFWTPYFSVPDPSSKRQSGFLDPVIGRSTNIGEYIRIPYFWVLGPDKDATISPEFTTGGGTFIGTQYRQYFGNGRLIADGSVTFGSESQVTINGITTPPATGLRGHLFTQSEFDIDENWRAGADIQRASDQTYLLRYRLPSPITSLNSHIYAENFGPSSYFNISGWGFQSLRSGVGDATQPFAAPLADYVWTSQPDQLGGRLSVEGNALDLLRLRGIDTRRLSTGALWRLPFDGAIGDRFAFSLRLRGDGYQSDNLPIAGTTTTESALAGRIFPQAALTWQYPWVRRGDHYHQIIEPVVMVAAAPNGGNPGTIPNEDSQGFEFDEASLFRPNRFPGFDRVDTGQRVDYGLRAGIYGDGGGSTRLIIGQSRSFQVDNNFLPGSGLDHHLSDIVGATILSPTPSLDLYYRFRLDHNDLAARRQEVGATFGPTNLRVNLNYADFAATPNLPGQEPIQQVTAAVSTVLTRYWSAYLVTTRSFQGSAASLNNAVTLAYRDECLAFILAFTKTGIATGDVTPGTAVSITFVFKNLGELGTRLGNVSGGL